MGFAMIPTNNRNISFYIFDLSAGKFRHEILHIILRLRKVSFYFDCILGVII